MFVKLKAFMLLEHVKLKFLMLKFHTGLSSISLPLLGKMTIKLLRNITVCSLYSFAAQTYSLVGPLDANALSIADSDIAHGYGYENASKPFCRFSCST